VRSRTRARGKSRRPFDAHALSEKHGIIDVVPAVLSVGSSPLPARSLSRFCHRPALTVLRSPSCAHSDNKRDKGVWSPLGDSLASTVAHIFLAMLMLKRLI
jgi:hypothetical protein